MAGARYFLQKDRQEQLTRLIRFLTDQDPLILVIGASGTGKSTLYQQLEGLGHLPQNSLNIKGESGLKPNKLIKTLYKAWNLGNYNEQAAKQEQLNEMLLALDRYHQSGLLVIDNAQKLPFSTLAAIMHISLIQNKNALKLRIVLLGTQRLAEGLDNLHNPNVHIPKITLQPLDIEETRAYIKSILDHLGVGTKRQVSQAVVSQIYQKSQGIPKTIYQMSVDLFTKGQRPQSTQQANATAQDSFWQRHWIKSACAAMLVFTFAGIHQYQVKMQQQQQFVSNTNSVQMRLASKAALQPELSQVKTLASAQAIKAQSYTIQLMGDHKITHVLNFEQKHHIDQMAHVLESVYHDKPWFTANIGNYKTKTQAQHALAHLPKGLKQLHPFIKPNR